MNLTAIIYGISTIVWVLPIFRQFRSNLFYFFLFLGICDPLTLLTIKTVSVKIELVSVIIAPILFYSIGIDRKKSFKINTTEILVFVLAYSLLAIIDNYNIILLIIHTLITIRVIYKIIIDLHHQQIINLLHLVLAFYMISSVASLIIYLNGDMKGIILFYINLAFQIVIAIFFSIFKEDDKKLIRKILPVNQD